MSSTTEILFSRLAKLKIARRWAESADPIEGIDRECRQLASDPVFTAAFRSYLASNPIIVASCESMLAQLALTAGVRWENTAPVLQPLSRRGWHLGRWLPTFLLVKGPLGRLFTDTRSPLRKRLIDAWSDFPFLCYVRDVFGSDEFRELRNGFGHWSFEWIEEAEPSVRVIDWKTGEQTIRLSLLECEAFHFLTASTVRAIDTRLMRPDDAEPSSVGAKG